MSWQGVAGSRVAAAGAVGATPNVLLEGGWVQAGCLEVLAVVDSLGVLRAPQTVLHWAGRPVQQSRG